MRYDEFSALSAVGPRGAVPPGPQLRAEAYGEWLAGRAPWQLFVTLTVKDLEYDGGKNVSLSGFTHVGVAGSERFLRSWFRNSVRTRAASSGLRAYGAFALEQHRDRVTPHFHGLLGGLPSWLVTDTAVGRATGGTQGGFLWRDWFRDHGRARIEPIRGVVGDGHVAAGAARYAAKYMTKDSGKFYALGTWPPVSEYDDVTSDDSEYERWDIFPGSENARRVWREMCEGEAVRW